MTTTTQDAARWRVAEAVESLRDRCSCLERPGVLSCRGVHQSVAGAKEEWAKTDCASHCGPCHGHGYTPRTDTDSMTEAIRAIGWTVRITQDADGAVTVDIYNAEYVLVARTSDRNGVLRELILCALDKALTARGGG